MLRLTSAVIVLGLTAGCGGVPERPRPLPNGISVPDVVSAIHAIATDGEPAPGPLTADERAQLAALYGVNVPRWVDRAGHPNPDAHEALTLLDHAGDEGLDPSDYGAARLDGQAAALTAAAEPTINDVAAFDAGLSAGALRYLRQLHRGRVDPRAIGFRLTVPADDHDFASILGAALKAHRIAEGIGAMAPALVSYRGLREMLARYRLLAADESLEPLAPPGATVHPGEAYAGLHAIRQRLVAFGDMPADTSGPDAPVVYDDGLVEGVKHFQARHGLTADGALGAGTQAALGVPLSRRVRQIELALERLRWLPDLDGGRFLAVNIPMFHLWGWESTGPSRTPALSMGAIVGRALNTQTPVFANDMRYLIFRPYWDVPPSILQHELLPNLARDPSYFERQDLEIVAGGGDNAAPVALSSESLAGLRQGRLRVRQRPGPGNSLGLVKFVFPNVDNIYLHGTPAMQLFSKARRDLSHGCVRVEDTVALAQWALEDQPEWTSARILAAMNGSRPLRVNLTRPIHVILFYVTAVVMPEDGTIHFADDIYGHDEKLDRALYQARTRPVSTWTKSDAG